MHNETKMDTLRTVWMEACGRLCASKLDTYCCTSGRYVVVRTYGLDPMGRRGIRGPLRALPVLK